MVSYTYDAWGKMISKTGTLATTLGTLQPFRYRGCIFDEETGLYYLRSKYYNPNLCRFINAADNVEDMGADGDINGYQLFIYCINDPVNNRDEAGSWSLPNWAKVAIGAALIVGAAVVATVATGGVACFAAGAAIGAAKGAVSGAIGGAITDAIQNRTKPVAGTERSKLLLTALQMVSLVVPLAVSSLAVLPASTALWLAR